MAFAIRSTDKKWAFFKKEGAAPVMKREPMEATLFGSRGQAEAARAALGKHLDEAKAAWQAHCAAEGFEAFSAKSRALRDACERLGRWIDGSVEEVEDPRLRAGPARIWAVSVGDGRWAQYASGMIRLTDDFTEAMLFSSEAAALDLGTGWSWTKEAQPLQATAVAVEIELRPVAVKAALPAGSAGRNDWAAGWLAQEEAKSIGAALGAGGGAASEAPGDGQAQGKRRSPRV